MRAWCLALMVLGGVARGEPVDEKTRVTGAVEATRVDDVSKREGKHVYKTWFRLRVEATDPADARARIGERAEFLADGEHALEPGARVSVLTFIAPKHGPRDRLPVYEIAPAATP